MVGNCRVTPLFLGYIVCHNPMSHHRFQLHARRARHSTDFKYIHLPVYIEIKPYQKTFLNHGFPIINGHFSPCLCWLRQVFESALRAQQRHACEVFWPKGRKFWGEQGRKSRNLTYGNAKKAHCGVVMYNVQLHFLLILVISSIEKKV